jgi:glycosyltransferase involved in cell wall biosynthesis
MRVLFITGAFPPMKCGVGDYTAKLVAHLETFPEIIPGVLTSSAAVAYPEPPKHFFPVMNHWHFSALGKVMETVKLFRPDIIHLQYPASFGRVFLPNFLPLVFAAREIPVVQTWHESPIYSQLINAIPKDTLLVVEPHYPAGYLWPYRAAVRHKKCVYIPIGANIPRAEPSLEQRSELRRRFDAEQARLIVYFGFVQPSKGVDALFRVADPTRDRLLLICDLDPDDSYHAAILTHAESPLWKGKCFVTGYLSSPEVAELLALSDAALFPFTGGTTARNGSVLAARLQGTFVVTTHKERRGYDSNEHTVYVAPGDITAMREAIDNHAGKRYVGVPAVARWDEIANKHRDLYENVLNKRC